MSKWRMCPPEMAVDDPYCPFKADVWYLGRMLSDTQSNGFVENVKHHNAFLLQVKGPFPKDRLNVVVEY